MMNRMLYDLNLIGNLVKTICELLWHLHESLAKVLSVEYNYQGEKKYADGTLTLVWVFLIAGLVPLRQQFEVGNFLGIFFRYNFMGSWANYC